MNVLGSPVDVLVFCAVGQRGRRTVVETGAFHLKIWSKSSASRVLAFDGCHLVGMRLVRDGTAHLYSIGIAEPTLENPDFSESCERTTPVTVTRRAAGLRRHVNSKSLRMYRGCDRKRSAVDVRMLHGSCVIVQSPY